MRANFIHIEPNLRGVLAANVPGDVAEFGVWHGTTFMPMAELARMYGKRIHAIDSFKGMAEGTERDGGRYGCGELSVGGSERFRQLTKPFGNCDVHEGFIPWVFDGMEALRFCFVHIDLDQYAPTLAAMRYAWTKMEPGGIIMCHDWFGNTNLLAAGAIADWMKESGVAISGEQTATSHCWFKKP